MSIFGLGDDRQDIYKPVPIPDRLRKNQRVAIITANKTEDLEFFYPFYRLVEEGYDVDVFTPDGEKMEAKHGLSLSETKPLSQARASDYELLYIPGGKAPAELKKNETALKFVHDFALSGKPIAAICHGPQVLAEAKLINGRQIAGWPEIQSEIEAAGATFVDEALVEDGQFITARRPGDLHRHLYGVIKRLAATSDKAKAA